MKILLVCPPYNFQGYTPTGLACLAGVAEQTKHEVQICDLNVERLPSSDFDLYGITGLSLWRKSIIQTAHLIKQRSKNPIIVGGAWATLQPKDAVLTPSIDYACIREGEWVFEEFLEKYPHVENIRGIATKNNLNEPASYIRDLDGLPFPAWHLINFQKYERVSIDTSRGCPFHCIFCAVHQFEGKRWRFRSVESILEEIQLLVHKFKVKHITFGDSNLTFEMERFEQICDEIINRKIKTEFDVVQGVRADKLNARLLEKMKKAGFTEIIIAPESGSQRVLDEVIDKRLDLATVVPVVEKCKELDLRCGAFFVIGFPWETLDEIGQTIAFADKLRMLGCSCYVGNALPLVGTRLYYQARAEGYLRFDGEKLEEIIHYLGLPRRVHCLTSPYWKPDEIIKICKREDKKNYRSIYRSYGFGKIASKFIRHPIRSIRRALRVT